MRRRACCALLLGLIWLGLQAGPAAAHAVLVSADPANGSSREQGPASLALRFDEDVLVASFTVTLRSADGAVRTIVGPPPAGAGASAAERSTEVALALPALPRGTYRAAWQARSADDLHLTTGTTVFGVGDPVVDAPTDRSGPAPDVPGLALRWLQLALLGLVVGAALHGAVVVPRSSLPETFRRQIQGQLGRAMGLGAALSALVGLAVLVQVSTGVEGSGAVVWTSAFGGFWLLGEASFLVLVLLAAGASTLGWDRRRSAVATVALTLALLATGGSGHVAPDAGRPLAVALLTAHLAAGAAWAGGLLVLLLLAGTSARRGRASWAHSLLRAFGAPAAVSLGVLVVTGVALTSRQVASVDALLTTTYGRVLVAKVGLGLLAGLLGLRTHRALHRAVPADRRSVRPDPCGSSSPCSRPCWPAPPCSGPARRPGDRRSGRRCTPIRPRWRTRQGICSRRWIWRRTRSGRVG